MDNLGWVVEKVVVVIVLIMSYVIMLMECV